MAKGAVVFDVDGTIWDSMAWFADILETLGGSPRTETIASLCEGGSIVGLMRRDGVSPTRFMRRAQLEVDSLPLYDGASDVLKNLHCRRVPLAIFTSLPGYIVEPLLRGRGIHHYFGAVINASNCRQRKPNPKGLDMALQALGVQPDASVLYVGDREIDAATAQNAGVTFAWASYGYEDKCPANANTQISSLYDLLAL